MAIGSAWPYHDEPAAEVRGRDLISGLPKTIVLSSPEVREAVEEPVEAVVDAVKYTLDKTPPELAADIMQRGIILTGGGALLRGLDLRLAHETGMPIVTADRPLQSVVIGSGACLEEFDVLHVVLQSTGRA
jgi:rod shape-determining protein MreB